MWYWGVATSFASKLIQEGIHLDEKYRESVEEFFKKVDKGVNLIEDFDPDSPASWIVVGSRVLKNLTNPEDVYDYAEDYLRAKEYVLCNGFFNFTRTIVNSLKKICKNKTVFRSKHMTNTVREFVHDSMENPFYLETVDKSYNLYVKNPVKDTEDIANLISQIFWGDSNCISLDRVYESNSGWQIYNNNFDLSQYEYWGSLEEIADRWPKYREMGVRRTALLHGRPGMGKTTFSYWLARKISNKTIVLMPNYLSSLTVKEWETLCSISNPTMVVFQDIHQVNTEHLTNLLEVFEEKPSDEFPDVPYIVCTANDWEDHVPEALLRPGRLGDEVYLLDEPTPPQIIDKIIDQFIDEFDIALVDEHRELLHGVYYKESASMVKELLKRSYVEGENVFDDMDFSTIADLKKMHEKKNKKKKFKVVKDPT